MTHATVTGVADDEALHVSRTCVIPLRELEWKFTPSGGPGGQHANRSNTRAEVKFDVNASTSLGPMQRARILERLGAVVRVVADDERSQLRNRDLALERLRARLADAPAQRTRRPTAPTLGSKQRRVETKRRRGDIKRSRRLPPNDE